MKKALQRKPLGDDPRDNWTLHGMIVNLNSPRYGEGRLQYPDGKILTFTEDDVTDERGFGGLGLGMHVTFESVLGIGNPTNIRIMRQ